MMGLIAGNGEGDALSPYVLFNNGRAPSLAGGIGSFFKIGLLLFGLLSVAKFFFGMAHMRRWRMAGGPDGGDWSGHRRHGPPWCWPQDEPEGEKADQSQPTPSEPSSAVNEVAAAVPATGEGAS